MNNSMSAQHTPGRNPWKTTSVQIAPSHVYILALSLDHMYPLEVHTRADGRALDALIKRGWIEHRKPECQYRLTETGRLFAVACRALIGDEFAAIAKATGGAE